MRLKVCHVISGDLWAGAEVMASQLIAGLNTKGGIDVFAVVLNSGRLARELQSAGVCTHVLEERELSFAQIARSLAWIVRTRNPQIIHAHRYKENLLASIGSLFASCKASLVTTLHGMPEPVAANKGRYGSLKMYLNFRLLASRFQRTVAVSNDIQAQLIGRYGLRAGRLEVIRNGIAIPSLCAANGEGLGFIVGSAGRLVPIKDYPLMIEMAALVCARSHLARFELAGEGPLRGELERLIAARGLDDRFMLKGFVEDTAGFYRGLDLYVNTSVHEGIPMSVLEAMAHGVPPLVGKVGGMQEIITDGTDGMLLADRSPARFAERCLMLSKDRSLLRRMSEAARRKVVEHFSVEKMVCDYVDLYCRLREP